VVLEQQEADSCLRVAADSGIQLHQLLRHPGLDDFSNITVIQLTSGGKEEYATKEEKVN